MGDEGGDEDEGSTDEMGDEDEGNADEMRDEDEMRWEMSVR